MSDSILQKIFMLKNKIAYCKLEPKYAILGLKDVQELRDTLKEYCTEERYGVGKDLYVFGLPVIEIDETEHVSISVKE